MHCVQLKDSNWAFVAGLEPEISFQACLLSTYQVLSTLPTAGYPSRILSYFWYSS